MPVPAPSPPLTTVLISATPFDWADVAGLASAVPVEVPSEPPEPSEPPQPPESSDPPQPPDPSQPPEPLLVDQSTGVTTRADAATGAEKPRTPASRPPATSAAAARRAGRRGARSSGEGYRSWGTGVVVM